MFCMGLNVYLGKEDKGSDKFDGPKEHSKEYEIA